MNLKVSAPRVVAEPLLTPAETAALLDRDPKTIRGWAQRGKLSPVFTPGGHRRYREAEVMALLATGTAGAAS